MEESAEIKRKKGVNGIDLAKWREMERDWLNKVVDIRNHDKLENPFELRKESGKCYSEDAT